MATNQEIIDALQRGKQYYSDELHEHTLQLQKGCDDCKCLDGFYDTFVALRYKVLYGQFDSVTQALYKCLCEIMGSYVPQVAPTVNAGADSTINLPTNTKIFVGSATSGTTPIVSYQWEQVSGPNTAILSGQTTLTLTATNLVQGTYVFRLTATDQNSLSGSDTVTLTVAQAALTAYYGAKANNSLLNYSQIVSSLSTSFQPNSSVTIPYEVPTLSYLWFAIPSGEPVKNYYEDLADILNQAPIGSEDDLYGAPTMVSGDTNYDFYITNYLTSYSKTNPVRGLRFKTL